MCYVHNQWYDISCATLYFRYCINSDWKKLCAKWRIWYVAPELLNKQINKEIKHILM